MKIKYSSYLILGILAGATTLTGNGCRQTKSVPTTEQTSSTVSSTAASDAINTSTAATSTQTVSLMDRSVSEWPRYEFKELGFSIQLPFASSSLNYGFHYCNFCINTSTYQYTGVVLKNGLPQYTFIGSYSQDYQYDRDGDITDIIDLEMGQNPKLVFFGMSHFKIPIKPIKKFFVQKNEILLFDATNIYKDADPISEEKRWGLVFQLPTSKKFKAVIITFNSTDITLQKMTQTAQTINFKRY